MQQAGFFPQPGLRTLFVLCRYHFCLHVLRRLEIVRERATGDRNMAGRVRERMRIMAEEAAMFDSDR